MIFYLTAGPLLFLIVIGVFIYYGPKNLSRKAISELPFQRPERDPGRTEAPPLFGGAEAVSDLWIWPLPAWVALTIALLFPLTNALSELSTYFGYALPRLQVLWHRRWLPVLLTAFMLSAQHIALPLVFDERFLFWRLTSFLPFALFLGLLIDWRPRLLPYLVIVHGLMDISVVAFVVMRSLAVAS